MFSLNIFPIDINVLFHCEVLFQYILINNTGCVQLIKKYVNYVRLSTFEIFVGQRGPEDLESWTLMIQMQQQARISRLAIITFDF